MTSSKLLSLQQLLFVVLCFVVGFSFESESPRTSARQTPVLGWSTWNQFQLQINESLIVDTLEWMKREKLRELGYEYVLVDDGWMASARGSNKELQADPVKFPNGMAWLADRIHEAGFKFGLHASIGEKTCHGDGPGSYGVYEKDAQTFAQWKVDYIKMDGCFLNPMQTKESIPGDFETMAKELMKTGRDIIFSIDVPNMLDSHEWGGSSGGNMWRVSNDITPEWSVIMGIADQNNHLYPYSKDSRFNDPDMLECGIGGLSVEESRSHFSLWSIMHAPLLIGMAHNLVDPKQMEIVKNKMVIDIDQDRLAVQGRRLRKVQTDSSHVEVWYKKLSGDRYAVLFFNRASDSKGNDPNYKAEKIFLSWRHLEMISTTPMRLYDVWQNKDLGIYKEEFTSKNLNQREVQLIIMSPTSYSSTIYVVLAVLSVLICCFLCACGVGSLLLHRFIPKIKGSQGESLYEKEEGTMEGIQEDSPTTEAIVVEESQSKLIEKEESMQQLHPL